jgi:hypothetical protein
MPPDSRREIVFVDSEPAAIYEHNPKINGTFRNWVTCIRDVDDRGCPACEKLGDRDRYLVGYFTVVDLSKWVDKKGVTHQFETCFLPVKFGGLKKLRRKADDAKEAGRTSGLAGQLYRISRDTDKDASSGGEFEWVRPVDMAKLFDVAVFQGRKLSDLYNRADESPTATAALKKKFQLELDPNTDGRIVRKLVPFNYMEILQPISYRDLKARIAGASSKDAQGNYEVPVDLPVAESEVPF